MSTPNHSLLHPLSFKSPPSNENQKPHQKTPLITNLHLPIRTIPGTQSLPEKSLRAAKSKTPGRVLPPFGICISTLRQREQTAAATLPRLYYSLRPKLFIHPFVPLSRSRAALSGTMGPVLFTFITRRCRRPSAMQSFSRYTLFFPSCMCAYISIYICVYELELFKICDRAAALKQ